MRLSRVSGSLSSPMASGSYRAVCLPHVSGGVSLGISSGELVRRAFAPRLWGFVALAIFDAEGKCVVFPTTVGV